MSKTSASSLIKHFWMSLFLNCVCITIDGLSHLMNPVYVSNLQIVVTYYYRDLSRAKAVSTVTKALRNRTGRSRRASKYINHESATHPKKHGHTPS